MPHSERANTATFLEEVMAYIQQLHQKVANLEQRLAAATPPEAALRAARVTALLQPPPQHAAQVQRVEGAQRQDCGTIDGAGFSDRAAVQSLHQQVSQQQQQHQQQHQANGLLSEQQQQQQQGARRAPSVMGLPSTDEVLAMAFHLQPDAPPAMPGLVGDAVHPNSLLGGLAAGQRSTSLLQTEPGGGILIGPAPPQQSLRSRGSALSAEQQVRHACLHQHALPMPVVGCGVWSALVSARLGGCHAGRLIA